MVWQDRPSQISQKVSGQLIPDGLAPRKTGKLKTHEFPQTSSGQFKSAFTLSWSHYVELISVKNQDERNFYEIEATSEGWSVPELKRQKASCLYERLALSRDKDGIRRLAREGQVISRPEDLFKEPLVLEFLGLEAQTSYSETDLESAIIGHLESFLLELGKGFLIVELTLPKDANIHAKEYGLYLPTKELLKAKLLEWSHDAETSATS